MIIKLIILFAMLAVVISLFVALGHLTRGDKDHSKKTLKHLTWRLGLSIALIVFLVIASLFGWITPHGL
jgi:Mn2+/Fe2+ NRAMP family transporter